MNSVLILSPQNWGHQQISKHHYAKALAQGHTCYFLNPPSGYSLFASSWKIEAVDANLYSISYNSPFPRVLKFKLPDIYRWLNTKWISRKIKDISSKFEMLIDFGYQREINGLQAIDAKRKIFFPVDNQGNMQSCSRGCSEFYSVSEVIVNRFNRLGIPMRFVHHGLSASFKEKAASVLQNDTPRDKNQLGASFNVGYAGNLCIPFIDRKNFLETIRSVAPGVMFHLYGNQKANTAEERAFLKELSGFSNVNLHGQKSPEALCEALHQMDALWICYRAYGDYNLENTHKLMEYLSTGKPIVATPLISKELKQAEISVFWEENQQHFQVINTLQEQQEKQSAISKNVRFALENTYENHVRKLVMSRLGH